MVPHALDNVAVGFSLFHYLYRRIATLSALETRTIPWTLSLSYQAWPQKLPVLSGADQTLMTVRVPLLLTSALAVVAAMAPSGAAEVETSRCSLKTLSGTDLLSQTGT